MTTIKDELREFTFLKDLKIYINEYIPFSSNHIIAFNEELDTQKDVKDGLLSGMIDREPEKATFHIEEALTRVTVKDHDPNDYVIFDASITYEEVVAQQENICVYVDAYGRVIYGARLISIDNEKNFSLDKLTRVIADLVMDSSAMINNLLSTYQRRLLDLVFSNVPEHRNKFIIMIAKEITPHKPACEYADGEDFENELNQILSVTIKFHDLSDNKTKIFFGTEGLIIISENPERFEDLINILGFYYGLDIFMKNYFAKMFMLWDELKEVRILLDKADVDPNAISEGKSLLSSVSASVVLMKELLSFMKHSVNFMDLEAKMLDLKDPTIREMADVCNLDEIVSKASDRVDDAGLVVSGLVEESHGITGLINSLAEKQMSRMNETLNDSIESMDEMSRTSERTGVALHILEVLLAGAIAFDFMTFFAGEYVIRWVVDWVAQNIFIWTAIGITGFIAIGYSLWRVVKWLEVKSEPNMRTRIHVRQAYNNENLYNFLLKKKIITSDSLVLKDNIIQEFTWDEEDKKWLGNKVRIQIKIDADNQFIYNANVEVNTPNKNITIDSLQAILMSYLTEEKIIS
ncbi:MAG: hypothetical protein EAX96_14550 [Candidatus Lokiarchaeota archaeon]|nr:hypothetical protein [Candidatus Lokiarchaeota archaeon]